MSYYTEEMGNGLTFVRDRISGLQGCYCTATGVYRFGDLRAPTLELLIAWGDERATRMAWYDQVTQCHLLLGLKPRSLSLPFRHR